MTQPGTPDADALSLLGGLIAEERRGRPGPARQAAEAAGQVIEAALAALKAGEPRRARGLLSQVDADASDALTRQVAACRFWAWQLDQNWYPGFVGGELAPDALDLRPPAVVPDAGDPATVLLEAVVGKGPVWLLTARTLAEALTRSSPSAAQQLVASTVTDLEEFRALADGSGDSLAGGWAVVAQIDLAHRTGAIADAALRLAEVRAGYEQFGDPVGVARTHLVEGDWHAAPGASPEVLGFDLEVRNQPSPLAGQRDWARAAACYQLAAACLEGVDAPGAQAALALRAAALAWTGGRMVEHAAALDQAEAGFAAAGFEADRRLVAVQRLLNRIGRGEVAGVRLESGTGWDLAPRGVVAEVLDWAGTAGSMSFAAGLGRLLQRAGEAWGASGDFERAEVAASLAVPLVAHLGPTPTASLLAEIATFDNDRDQPGRALVRLEQALERWEAPTEVGSDARGWLSRGDLLMSVANAQTNRMGSSGAVRGIPGLERALAAFDGLLAVPDLPTADVAQSLLAQGRQLLDALLGARQDDDLAALEEASQQDMTAQERQMLATGAQAIREQAQMLRWQAALWRGRLAESGGWDDEARRWLNRALELADAAGPASAYAGVLTCVVQGRFDEARERLAGVAGMLPAPMLGPLALRARAFETARDLFAQLDAAAGRDALEWVDLADRAEAELETGDPRAAAETITEALRRFEERVAALGRDPDRRAAIDDTSAAAAYLLATRAELALADGAGDDAARRAHLDRALMWGDRARSLSIQGLIGAGAQNAPPEWQQAATVWSAAFDRLLASHETGDVDAGEAASQLTEADHALVAVEAELEERRPEVLAAARRIPPPRPAAGARAALPDGTAAVQFQVLGRDLLVLGFTNGDVVGGYQRLGTPEVARLANRMLRSCLAGDPGDEAAALAELVLAPVADLVAAHQRLVLVPMGPLYSVPFHALPFGGELLSTTHVISTLPATALLEQREVDAPLSGSGAVVVGDPAFDADAHPDLRRLPGAAVEAEALASLLGTTDVLLHGAATRAALQPLLADRAVVHLAAHGRLDEVVPSTSSIVLAGRDELTVADLVGMRLASGLAVLSACDTGRGAATLGGDLVGLTRGLLAAGVERAVVSLWPVDDLAACVTMEAFHRQLGAGAAPAAALAMAQREVRALDAAGLADRYRELGGEPGEAVVRRGPATGPAARGRQIAKVDEPVDEDFDDDTGALPGSLARSWAPFILVGV